MDLHIVNKSLRQAVKLLKTIHFGGQICFRSGQVLFGKDPFNIF